MSKVQLAFVWDGETDPFAYRDGVPSNLVPAIGMHVIVYPHRWTGPDKPINVNETDEDTEGDWVKDGAPVRATVLDHRLDLAVYPLEQRDNGTRYDDEPALFFTLILGKLGE